jgi:hypothetical protein
MTQAAWDTIPCSYIVTTKDYLPEAAQELLAQKAKAEITRIHSSHSPFLSQPTELAILLRRELERATEV